MGKNSKQRFVLADFKKKKAEEGVVEIEGEGGTIFTVPPPALWSDDVLALADGNPLEASRALLGEETYEQWVAEGGNASTLMMILREAHGLGLGE